MKIKTVFIVAGLTLTASGMFAQNGSATVTTGTTTTTTTTTTTPNIMSKKGEMYLPQAGDWALSLDATPWLDYFSNLFHGANGNAGPSFLNSNQTIVGKYFVDDHTAYRALLRIGFNSYSQNQEVFSSDTGTAFPTPQVEDKRSISSHYIGLGFGMEKRKGNTRLQGYYGIEVMVFMSGSDTTFTYGNAYNATTNATPVWYNWNTQSNAIGLSRPTEIKQGSTFGVSVLGYLGVEYFIAPKLSIGGEFTWGPSFRTTSQGSISIEELNANTGADQTDTYKTSGSSAFSLDNGWNQAFGSGSGSLYINFHF